MKLPKRGSISFYVLVPERHLLAKVNDLVEDRRFEPNKLDIFTEKGSNEKTHVSYIYTLNENRIYPTNFLYIYNTETFTFDEVEFFKEYEKSGIEILPKLVEKTDLDEFITFYFEINKELFFGDQEKDEIERIRKMIDEYYTLSDGAYLIKEGIELTSLLKDEFMRIWSLHDQFKICYLKKYINWCIATYQIW